MIMAAMKQHNNKIQGNRHKEIKSLNRSIKGR